jgi:hypothetical protein
MRDVVKLVFSAKSIKAFKRRSERSVARAKAQKAAAEK